jgi:ABC-type amino acid transport substrate-binding protein
MQRIVVGVVTAFFALTTQAQAAPVITADTVALGNTQFQRICAQCHGRNLVSSGTSAPDLRRFPPDQPARFVTSVTHGKGNMPAFKDALSSEQIATLWAYVATRGGKDMPEPVAETPANPGPPEVDKPAPSLPPLKVCMAEDNPPLSYAVKGSPQPQGFDVRVAQAIAAAQARPLAIILFESKFEQESTLSQEVGALLASGVCDLASGFPLIASDLGAPSRPTARVPDYPGAPRRASRAWVPLVPIAATLAYHATALTVATRDRALTVNRLDDLQSLRIGANAGSLAGAILMMHKGGSLRSKVVSLSREESALAKLEAGDFDAAMVSSDQLDAWKLKHPASLLVRSPYQHPLRINLGMVARADAAELVSAVNTTIAQAKTDGSLQRWAKESGVTWIAPTEPNVRAAVGMADLLAP